ncbi:hypothetical protein L7D48_01110 [Streptomyces sp. S1A]|nr:hypothetical protein [Streptomyces sp. ICN903]MCG3039183.1 hypothetical protein [Streptomyces sp. ICN903]
MTDQQQTPETPGRRMSRLIRATSPVRARRALADAIRGSWNRKGQQQ